METLGLIQNATLYGITACTFIICYRRAQAARKDMS